MAHSPFDPDWIKQFTDPYAVLGVSLAADERRILKRYRQVAKVLHPDAHVGGDSTMGEFANQTLARLVNPAYQRLKAEKDRSETLATLRFKVRRLSRDNTLNATGEQAQQLLNVPEPEIEIFYEQALLKLSEEQYNSPDNFDALTRQISELNLIYLRRKMGEPIIREKRSGLVAAGSVGNVPVPAADAPRKTVSYAERHSVRAQDYLKNGNYSAAIQELKDALKIDAHNSSYHCLIGQAYLLNQLPGMAKVHFKQAIKLNPKNDVALKYARQLQIDLKPDVGPQSPPAGQASSKRRGLFGGIFSRS
ncbi:MAG TPA: DnaJ domain-containing protein [Leptolyngbyaceae cyanobacterium]